MHDAITAAPTGMMVTGTVAQRDVFLDQVKQLGSIRDVRVLRSEAAGKIYGLGTAKDDSHPDSLEQQVMSTGKAVVVVWETDAKGEYLRVAVLTLAMKNSRWEKIAQPAMPLPKAPYLAWSA